MRQQELELTEIQQNAIDDCLSRADRRKSGLFAMKSSASESAARRKEIDVEMLEEVYDILLQHQRKFLDELFLKNQFYRSSGSQPLLLMRHLKERIKLTEFQRNSIEQLNDQTNELLNSVCNEYASNFAHAIESVYENTKSLLDENQRVKLTEFFGDEYQGRPESLGDIAKSNLDNYRLNVTPPVRREAVRHTNDEGTRHSLPQQPLPQQVDDQNGLTA